MKLKYQIIFRPLCILALCLIIGYLLIAKIILIPNEYFDLNEAVFHFYIPLALPWAPMYYIMLPRFDLLKDKSNRSSLNFVLSLLSCLLITITIVLALDYLDKASGKMEHLQTISVFEKKGSPQYCTLKNVFILNRNYGFYNEPSISGRGATLNYNICITLPIFEKMEDTIRQDCNYWLSVEYRKSISNRIAPENKAKAFRDFKDWVIKEISKTNYNQFEYLELLSNNDLRRKSENAILESNLVRYKDPVYFKSSKEPFEKRFGHLLLWGFVTLLVGGIIIGAIIFGTDLKDELS